MLKVKTKIDKSKVHGIGLYADEFIPKGTITWEYSPGIDVTISKETLQSMNQINRDYFNYYAYFDKKIDKIILCTDNQRFINHTNDSKRENITSTPSKDVAARDIEIGEEFLCDYNKFDDNYFERMKITKDSLK